MSRHGRSKWKGYPGGVGGPAKPPQHMQRYLDGLTFPARKRSLLEQARIAESPRDVLEVLERLPDHFYATAADVMTQAQLVYAHH